MPACRVWVALFAVLAVFVLDSPRVLAVEATSRRGLYRISLLPGRDPIPLNEWQEFVLRLQRTDGAPLRLRDLVVDGGMPAHGHGLPSQPRIKQGSRSDEFVVAGLRFSMSGTWELRVLAADERGADEARFQFALGTTRSAVQPPGARWTDAERETLRSLSLASLGSTPSDPTNRVADDSRAVALGHALFFEPGLSAGGKISCASCHDPARAFTDGRRTARGRASLDRNTPTLVGAGHGRWFFADGRRDSLWSQALEPLEASREMNATRVGVVQFVIKTERYRQAYTDLFGALPDVARFSPRTGPSSDEKGRTAWSALSAAQREAVDRAFSNVGKALAAYERRLLPGRAPFDDYVDAVLQGDAAKQTSVLSHQAELGLRIFMSQSAQCLRCHNGPLFTNGEFGNVGTGTASGIHPDFGQSIGMKAVSSTVFTCLGPYSDDPARECPELRFLESDEEDGLMVGAYKVPTLRNVAQTAPYMHDGRFVTLREAIEHYRHPAANMAVEFKPLIDFPDANVNALAAFLASLSGPIAAPPELLRPPARISRGAP